jgi:hypothetical protein
MGLQSRVNINFGNFKTPTWESETKWHLGVSPVAMHKIYYKRKVVASFKFGLWWILWVRVCPWLVHAPKVFQLCINQLVVWFVWFVWVIELLVNLPSPHPGVPTRPCTPKCYELGNAPQLLFLSMSSPFDLQWVHQRAWGCVTCPQFEIGEIQFEKSNDWKVTKLNLWTCTKMYTNVNVTTL